MAPFRRAIVLAACFILLAAAVSAGLLDGVNRWSTGHLLLATSDHPRRSALADVILAPAAPLVAVAIVLGAAWLMRRRDRRAPLVWGAVLAASFLVELAGKALVDQRHSPVWEGYGFTLDSSFPSGHMMRAVLITAAVASVWPRARIPLVLWALAAGVALVFANWHLPTDIAGGV